MTTRVMNDRQAEDHYSLVGALVGHWPDMDEGFAVELADFITTHSASANVSKSGPHIDAKHWAEVGKLRALIAGLAGGENGPLISEARQLIADCATYNFGMRTADRLAHVVAGHLADALEVADADVVRLRSKVAAGK